MEAFSRSLTACLKAPWTCGADRESGLGLRIGAGGSGLEPCTRLDSMGLVLMASVVLVVVPTEESREEDDGMAKAAAASLENEGEWLSRLAKFDRAVGSDSDAE